MSIRELKAGAEITEGWVGDLVAVANQCNLGVGDGGRLTITEGPDGYTIDVDFSEPIWGRITGPLASGTYPFIEIFPDTSGAWVDGTMTDVAYEADGNTSVATGKRVQLSWTSQADWRFRAGTC